MLILFLLYSLSTHSDSECVVSITTLCSLSCLLRFSFKPFQSENFDPVSSPHNLVWVAPKDDLDDSLPIDLVHCQLVHPHHNIPDARPRLDSSFVVHRLAVRLHHETVNDGADHLDDVRHDRRLHLEIRSVRDPHRPSLVFSQDQTLVNISHLDPDRS